MKRAALLRHLRLHGCVIANAKAGLIHCGANPATGQTETIPRHIEIADLLARKICRGLSVPQLGRE